MAAITFPSWAYNSAGQPAVIVQTLAQFTALPLPGTWQLNGPYPSSGSGSNDPGFTVTDTRLQQLLVEARLSNLVVAQMANTAEELTALRAEIVALDSGLTT